MTRNFFTYKGGAKFRARIWKHPEEDKSYNLDALVHFGKPLPADVALYVAPVKPAPTPEEVLAAERGAMIVSPWQLRKALNRTGTLRGQINAMMNSADQDTKDGWEVATSFERLHPMVIGMGQALNLSDTELDDLFRLAATT